jgi:TatD DNase family protein
MTNINTNNTEFLRGLTDTHAHLSFLNDRGIDAQAHVRNLFDAGFSYIIDIGTNAVDLTDRINAFVQFPCVRFAAGIWPTTFAIESRHEQIDHLRHSIDSAPAGLTVAIGECGFDRRESPQASTAENELFEMQLDIAREKKLPIIVHTREAAEEAQTMLASYKDVRAIIHCFSYTVCDAKKFLDLGCYISFAGNLTFKNAPDLRDAIKVIPADRLLLETDCPFLAPVPFRGQTAHPAMILETFKLAANLRNVDLETLKLQLQENIKSVFF